MVPLSLLYARAPAVIPRAKPNVIDGELQIASIRLERKLQQMGLRRTNENPTLTSFTCYRFSTD